MSKFVSLLALLLGYTLLVWAAEDCTPTSERTNEVANNNCGLFSNSLEKRESYSIKYPNDSAPTLKGVEGKGTCGGGTECWPEFHPEEYGDGFWRKRIVDKQAAFLTGSQTWACSAWTETTFTHPPGQTSCPQTCEAGGGYDMWNGCTPVIVDTSGDGFQLTDVTSGVNFDFDGDGQSVRTAWTAAGSRNAFLVLDRDGNGQIDNGSELFGNFSPQPPTSEPPNGYIALADYDKFTNGGNGDSKIDAEDAIYNSLRLWIDANHNGISESSELFTLTSLGVLSLDLDYRESKKRDQYGNLFFYRSQVSTNFSPNFARWCYDVILNNRP
jgi:hypothetical protein